jgi:hypothetical protein
MSIGSVQFTSFAVSANANDGATAFGIVTNSLTLPENAVNDGVAGNFMSVSIGDWATYGTWPNQFNVAGKVGSTQGFFFISDGAYVNIFDSPTIITPGIDYGTW